MDSFQEFLSRLWIHPMRDHLSLFLWCMYLAVLCATAYAVYKNRTFGLVLRHLQQKGAFSPETAQSVEELALQSSLGAKAALKSAAFLSLIRFEGEEKRPSPAAKLWIPEEQKKKAEFLAKGKLGIKELIFCAIVFYFVMMILSSVLPQIIPDIEVYIR